VSVNISIFSTGRAITFSKKSRYLKPRPQKNDVKLSGFNEFVLLIKSM
jgi:hypothetical protein